MATPGARFHVARLVTGDDAMAKLLFSTMADVFEEEHTPLSDEYVGKLLAQEQLWVVAATMGDEVVGGLTAHLLPMTRSESREIFIYDIAVRASHQRRGVGRLLMSHLAGLAGEVGIANMFMAADDEDSDALEFYRALGGVASPVTFFTFGRASDE